MARVRGAWEWLASCKHTALLTQNTLDNSRFARLLHCIAFISGTRSRSCICWRMASPVTIRQPLTTRTVNTPFFDTKTPVVGQKRSHSQITGGGQENLQTQILGALKSPSRPVKRNLVSRPTVQVQPQFKQPLPRAQSKSRQRQQTNDPAQTQEGDSKAMQDWRRSMKATFASSTFYFDGLEESFKEQVTRWILRFGGVYLLTSKLIIESRAILFECCNYRRNFTRSALNARITRHRRNPQIANSLL